jgi:hypothetical protein
MKVTPEHDKRMATLSFAEVYPHYITKVEKKGGTKQEVHQVIEWLTGFTSKQIQEFLEQKTSFQEFFAQATLNPNASMIKGIICGYRIEEIETPLTRNIRYLDKLIDEIAKRKKMEKILRTS